MSPRLRQAAAAAAAVFRLPPLFTVLTLRKQSPNDMLTCTKPQTPTLRS